jgi:pimeloyl-ACP methyl ester carboxylesterase
MTEVLAHRVEGDGEPLLLLNGGMMTYASWEPVAAVLRRHFRLVRCDLRGQLLSPGDVPVELPANVGDLTALLDHLGIEETHVLGTSYGGEIALLMAALAPRRVRSLVAVTVADYATEVMASSAEELRQIIAAERAGGDLGRLHDRLVAEVYSDGYRTERAAELAERRWQIARLPARWFDDLEDILTAVESLDLRSSLAAIRCPTLIVIAAADRTIPPGRSRALAAAIDGAETRIHRSSGHALVAEDPEWLARVALDFLARHRGADAVGRART